nr:PREDICTED: LOW QUALITY PROTEIN: probable RNA-binding protein EIF1AD [Struthio camelus australis]
MYFTFQKRFPDNKLLKNNPKPIKSIVIPLTSAGTPENNSNDLEIQEVAHFHLSMPTTFHKNSWRRQGDFLLVNPTEDKGGKDKMSARITSTI